jgi:hypothetical protein
MSPKTKTAVKSKSATVRKPSANARPKRSNTAKKSKAPKKSARWSHQVMMKSDAMDLKEGVFKLKSARAIAQSLKRSAEASHRRKSPPFRSAMSMLNFEINRAGKNLSAERLSVLNRAKDELRKAFGREAG